jgi:small subunit ribosomal protein S2
MTKVPSAVWIVDTKKEHLAVFEARKLKLPVIAILDTNCDPDEVDYKIPGNDDAIRSVTLLTRVVADAVADGLMARSAARGGDASQEGVVATDEPMAEWERELLSGEAKGAAETTGTADAAASAEAPAEAPAADATAADAPVADATAAEAPAAEAPAADAPAAETPAADAQA